VGIGKRGERLLDAPGQGARRPVHAPGGVRGQAELALRKEPNRRRGRPVARRVSVIKVEPAKTGAGVA